MKFLLSTLLLFTALIGNGQVLKPGDNLQAAFKKVASPYYFPAPTFTAWIEAADMLLIGDKPNPIDCDFLFLVLHDTTLIGVFKTKEPNLFMFDTEGNSILSNASQLFYLPTWVVKNKTKFDPTDKTILEILDKMYEQTLQADDGRLDQNTIRQYQKFQTDTSLANRHIALLFDTYQTILTETATKGEKAPADICVPLMKSLAGELLSLYNRIPAIVCVYMGEALQSAGMIDEARKHFAQSLQFYPDSIPLLVYNYRLEPDGLKQKKQLAELKKKYAKHWMVKSL